jgi:hypothetical protein
MRRTFLWTLLCASYGLACNGTHTGNPFAPGYTSSRFAPDQSGSQSGNGAGNFRYEWHSAYGRGKSERFAFFRGYLVTPGPNGLLVLDVSDRTKPQIAAELELRPDTGLYDMLADDSGVTLAISERVKLDVATVPKKALRTSRDSLVHIDLTDPLHPRRSFEVELAGKFVRRRAQGTSHYVLQQLVTPELGACVEDESAGRTFVTGPFERVTALRATRYEMTTSGFEAQESFDLASDTGDALAVADGDVVVDGAYTGAGQLRLIDFASGRLAQSGPLQLDGQVLGADRHGDVLVLLVAESGKTVLELYTLEATGELRARGRLRLPYSASIVTLFRRDSAFVDGEEIAFLIDLADLDAPKLGTQFPGEVSRLFDGPTGLVGLGHAEGDNAAPLVVTLWDASNPSAAVQVARLATEWDYDWNFTLDAAHAQLYFANPAPASAVVGGSAQALAVLALGDMNVTEFSEQAARSQVVEPVRDGDQVFSVSKGGDGVEIFPLVAEARESTPVSTFLSFQRPPKPGAQLDVGDKHLTLYQRATDGVSYIEVRTANGDSTELELPHVVDSLIAVGERVVAFGAAGELDVCDTAAKPSVEPVLAKGTKATSAAVDPCAPWLRPGLSVLAFDGAPRIVKTLPHSYIHDVEVIEDVEVTANGIDDLMLEDGRLALLVNRTQRCYSQASCDRIGVKVPLTQETCNHYPCQPRMVPNFGAAGKDTLAIYTLEAIASAAPKLVLGPVLQGSLSSEGSGLGQVGALRLVTRDGLALSHTEPLTDATGSLVVDAHGGSFERNYLDVITRRADGVLQAQPTVITPGRPVAVLGNEVYCLEPHRSGDAIEVQLHRAAIHGQRAVTAASLDLGSGFLGALTIEDRLWVLRAPSNTCEPGASTDRSSTLFSVPLTSRGPLRIGPSLMLPGSLWLFGGAPNEADGMLVIAGGPAWPGGQAEVDLSNPAMPVVRRYASP